MIETLAVQVILFITFMAFATKRVMNFMHALQQDDYHNGRFIAWIFKHKVFDSRVSACLVILELVAALAPVPELAVNTGLFMVFVFAAYFEKDARKETKKPLVLTKRALRILSVSIIYAAVVVLVAVYLAGAFYWLIAVQILPFLLVAGNASLNPYEGVVQKTFYTEAQERLAEVSPVVIGITGSYGKTSVKHILGHILGKSAPTLVTPGSVNTLMGITRIIRERLQDNHQYFIVEMGAYGPRSIANLCALTPPDYGIISSIGHAHYERFKTLETVVEAKYELAEAVLAKNGTVIVHEKTLKFEYSREMRHKNMENFVACGEPLLTRNPKNEQEFSYLTPDDLKILSVEQTPKGLCVIVEWQGERHTLRAPLYGVHHGHNIALAFVTAVRLGMSPKDIRSALATVPQIKHRLEVKEQSDGSYIIDDAFNSNPPGFRAALHVSKVLSEHSGGRAILVTPGIVELGVAHDEVHRTIGQLAAEVCDVVLLIQPKRIPTFVQGFDEKQHDKTLIEFETFTEAQGWLVQNKQKGDVILLENDLPDIYEQVLKI